MGRESIRSATLDSIQPATHLSYPPEKPLSQSLSVASLGDKSDDTLHDLFKSLSIIQLPEVSKTLKTRSFRLKTSFFHGGGESGTFDNNDSFSLFLRAIKRFFRKEKRFWRLFYQSNHAFSHLKKKNKTNRPWSLAFNIYISSNITRKERAYLSPHHFPKYCEILNKYITIQNQQNVDDEDNPASAVSTLDRAADLLHFLETHKEDTFSCIVGQQAQTAIITNCINHAKSAEEPPIDLSRYLIELSTIKNDIEVAKSVKVMSAKLRGVFTHVSKGDIVLVNLPGSIDECIHPPESIRIGAKIYSTHNTLVEYLSSLNNSLFSEKPGGMRAVYARCATKPTNDNWIGLWLNPIESEESIVWVPVGSIFCLEPEYLEWLKLENKDDDKVFQLIINQLNKLDIMFKNDIEEKVVSFVKQHLHIGDEDFSRITRSKTLFTDERMLLQISSKLGLLMNSPNSVKDLKLINNLTEKRDQLLKNIDTMKISALYRSAWIKQLKGTSESDYFLLIETVLESLKNQAQSRLQMVELNREKILNGSRKKHVTGWWLKETRRTVQTYLKELGYKYEAIPKDYTNQPPNNLSLVKRNLQIVDEVLDESSKQNKQLQTVVSALKSRIYPKMDELLYDLKAVMLYEVENAVTSEAIENFNLEDISKKIEEMKNNGVDTTKIQQVDGMIKDVEYISMMKILEDNAAERCNHPHIVPISGLVNSSIVRLRSECCTVLELWSPVVKAPPKSRASLKIICCKNGPDIEKSLKDIQDSEFKVEDGNTRLHELASINVNGCKTHIAKLCGCCQILLCSEEKDNINSLNSNNESPLLVAIKNGNIELSCIFIDSKAVITDNVRNYLNQHPNADIEKCIQQNRHKSN